MSSRDSRLKRQKILARDDFRCQICGVQVNDDLTDKNKPNDYSANLDHIVTKYENGGSSYNNLATTCRKCNLKRGKRKSHDFIKLGCHDNLPFIKNLIAYEKRFGIFDEELFFERVVAYKKKLDFELKNIDKIISFLI